MDPAYMSGLAIPQLTRMSSPCHCWTPAGLNYSLLSPGSVPLSVLSRRFPSISLVVPGSNSIYLWNKLTPSSAFSYSYRLYPGSHSLPITPSLYQL